MFFLSKLFITWVLDFQNWSSHYPIFALWFFISFSVLLLITISLIFSYFWLKFLYFYFLRALYTLIISHNNMGTVLFFTLQILKCFLVFFFCSAEFCFCKSLFFWMFIFDIIICFSWYGFSTMLVDLCLSYLRMRHRKPIGSFWWGPGLLNWRAARQGSKSVPASALETLLHVSICRSLLLACLISSSKSPKGL